MPSFVCSLMSELYCLSRADGSQSRRSSYHLSTPLRGSGVKTADTNIDQSLVVRTSSYLVTVFEIVGSS